MPKSPIKSSENQLFKGVEIRLPKDIPPKEPVIYEGVVVVMKIPYEKFNEIKNDLYGFVRQNGIAMDVA